MSVGVLMAAAVASAVSTGASEPVYAPPAAWVEVAPVPPAPVDASRAVQPVLHDYQFRLHRDGTDETFRHHADLVAKPEGLTSEGTLRLSWNPSHDVLTIHSVTIHRGGQTLDALAGGRKFTVLRRETGLERLMLDGRLTATLQVDDLRVGDVLETAYTVTGRDPTLGATNAELDSVNHRGVIARVRDRFLWEPSDPMRWRASTSVQPVQSRRSDGWVQLDYDQAAVPEVDGPVGAPARFGLVSTIEVTDFRSWTDLSAIVGPLFRQSAQLAHDSPLKTEARRIAALSPDPAVRAVEALRLVQGQVRYFAVAVGEGGLRPATADETWARRFGDCKGKTVTLLALLRELGIEAEPALARIRNSDLAQALLPTPAAFDHVLVRATIGGRTYWLDPTRAAESGRLTDLPVPRYRWALPLWSARDTLEEMVVPPSSAPLTTTAYRLDFSQGVDRPGPAELTLTLRDEAAEGLRTAIAAAGLETLRRSYLSGSASQLKAMTAETFDIDDRPAAQTLVVRVTGRTRPGWEPDEDLGRSRFAWPQPLLTVITLPKRQPKHTDVPFALNYPAYAVERIEITLPNGGAGFDLRGPDGCVKNEYREACAAAVKQGATARFERSLRNLAPEAPAAALLADQDRMVALLDRKVSILGPKTGTKTEAKN